MIELNDVPNFANEVGNLLAEYSGLLLNNASSADTLGEANDELLSSLSTSLTVFSEMLQNAGVFTRELHGFEHRVRFHSVQWTDKASYAFSIIIAHAFATPLHAATVRAGFKCLGSKGHTDYYAKSEKEGINTMSVALPEGAPIQTVTECFFTYNELVDNEYGMQLMESEDREKAQLYMAAHAHLTFGIDR